MHDLASIYSSYEATCWLSKPRREFNGLTAAVLIKNGEEKKVYKLLRKNPKLKKKQDEK